MDLITGSTGFVGQRLYASLLRDGRRVRGLSRRKVADGSHVTADLQDFPALIQACKGVERIFHCAGYAHAGLSRLPEEHAKHFQINFEGTRQLIEAAGECGVRRFVFLSSVKAMAEPGDACIDETFPGIPATPYGQAKRAAEEIVLATGQKFGMHVVNLRLAMVYGSGGRGNLERMGRMVKAGWFPPLPETWNHRSLVHVDDVISAIKQVAVADRAAGATYIVASSEAPSGRQLYESLRLACGLRPVAWQVPLRLLRGGALLGDLIGDLLHKDMMFNSEILSRLLASAWYSPGKINRDIGWQAKVPLQAGLREMLEC